MSAAALRGSLVGDILAEKYRVIREIGRGGMGVVYECEHMQLGKRVAIKLMLEKYNDDSEATARFQREAFAASRIGNPHIIDVTDIGTAPDGRAFVVMELLSSGQSLASLLEARGPLPVPRALSIMRQVLRAVGAAHAKGIVHRDLKPDNIFLLAHEDQQDFVKLLDFGIHKVIDVDEAVAATKLTTTGVVIGTPLYMAPEQAMGNPVDRYADIYACGVMLYEMLAGQPPFEGATYAVLIAKLLTSDPPLLSDVREGLPPKLVAAVHRALEKEPEARFRTAEEFASALPSQKSASQLELAGTMQSGRHPTSPLVPTPAPFAKSSQGAMVLPPRRRWPWIAGAVALVGAAAATAFALMGGSPAQPAPALAAGSSQVTPSPTPPPSGSATADKPPPAAIGRLKIEVPGALVSIDRVARGPSPVDVSLPAGDHEIELSAPGYEPVRFTREIRDGQETTIAAELTQLGARMSFDTKPVRNKVQKAGSKVESKPGAGTPVVQPDPAPVPVPEPDVKKPGGGSGGTKRLKNPYGK